MLNYSIALYLEPESAELEDELHGEEHGEDDVEHVEEGRVALGLAVELHGQAERVDQDHGEDRVLEDGRGDEGPQLVLNRVLGDVAPHRLGVQRELYAVSLGERNEMVKVTGLEDCSTVFQGQNPCHGL